MRYYTNTKVRKKFEVWEPCYPIGVENKIVVLLLLFAVLKAYFTIGWTKKGVQAILPKHPTS
jgi:hypothetical protein